MNYFCRHDWGIWSRPIPTYNSGKKIQWRECKRCGMATHRILSWDEQTDMALIIKALDDAAARS